MAAPRAGEPDALLAARRAGRRRRGTAPGRGVPRDRRGRPRPRAERDHRGQHRARRAPARARSRDRDHRSWLRRRPDGDRAGSRVAPVLAWSRSRSRSMRMPITSCAAVEAAITDATRLVARRPRHVTDRAGPADRAHHRGGAPVRGAGARRRRARTGAAPGRPRHARRRLLDRQLPQVAVRSPRHGRARRGAALARAGPSRSSRPGTTPRASRRRSTSRGTQDQSAWLVLGDALDLLDELSWDRLRAHGSALADHGQQVVAEALGVPATEPVARARPLDAVRPAASRRGLDRGGVACALADRSPTGSACEVAVTNLRGRGLLRLSAHAYNAPADYDRLALGLRDLLRSG